MLDANIFSKYKTKQDFDLEREEFEARRRQRALQDQLGGLQVAQAQKSLMQPEQLDMQQLIAKSIQAGGVQNLSPQEQAQLQAFDMSQRLKQTTDARGNVITNRSVFDLMGGAPSDVMAIPTSQAMSMSMQGVSPTTQPVANTGDFIDVASQPDLPTTGLPQELVDPTVVNEVPLLPIPQEPNYSGLSPFAVEDARMKYLEDVRAVELENARLLREAEQAQVSKEKARPEAQRQFNIMRDDTQNMLNTIDTAIGQTGAMSAGFIGGMTGAIPGTPAKNLEATLNTVAADSAFSTLQAMREASKTGGALGAISERELALLRDARASLEQSQDPENLVRNLENYKRIRANSLRNVAEAYKQDYGQYPEGFEDFMNQQNIAPANAVSWEEYF